MRISANWRRRCDLASVAEMRRPDKLQNLESDAGRLLKYIGVEVSWTLMESQWQIRCESDFDSDRLIEDRLIAKAF